MRTMGGKIRFKRIITISLMTFLISNLFYRAFPFVFEDLSSGTDVDGGHIHSDTTWLKVDSPYIIKGDVIVDLGATLTIEPGVEVKFNGDYYLYIDGNLTALGDSIDHIIFTSNRGGPKQGDWESIRINSTGHLRMNYCDVSFGSYAIHLNGASYNYIENSTVSNSERHGIYIRYSAITKIINCNIGPNNWNGIYFYFSSIGEVNNCTVHTNSFQGISISDSSYIDIVDCESYSNEVNGVHIFQSEDITILNTVIHENLNMGIAVKLAGNLLIDNCDIFLNTGDGLFLSDNLKGKISNCTVNDHENGIYLQNSTGFTIENSEVYNNAISGMTLIDSSYNILDTLDIFNSGNWGIYLTKDLLYEIGSSHNRIKSVDISDSVYGIMIRFSENNSVENSYIHENTNGFIAQQCDIVDLNGNNISNNQYYGISYIGSSNGLIAHNELYNNHYGIFLLAPSINNLVHHNRIIEHAYYAYGTSTSNQWDDGAEGNYWGNYDDVDLDGNGIGDTPYSINPVGEDRYPLVDFYNTRFKIMSSIPMNESILVPVTTTIKFSFSESAVKETVEGNITIEPYTPISSFLWEDSDKNLTLSLPPLSHGELYSITINQNAKGTSGRNLQYPFVLIFYTENPSDTTPPRVMDVYPTGSEVLINTSIIHITFSELMIRSGTESAFSIHPEIRGEFDWEGNTLIFYPEEEFLDLTTYTVTINGSEAKDAVGHTLDGNGNGTAEGSPIDDFSWSFKTTRYDITPPTIKKAEPTGNMVDINSPIKIYFSELMNKTSVEEAFSFTDGTFTWTSEDGIWGRSAYTMSFTPSEPFSYHQLYTVALKASAMDWYDNTLDGNVNGTSEGSPIDDYIWSFKTIYDVETGFPTINNFSPVGSNVTTSTEISINFSQTMNQNSVEEAFTITDGFTTWDKDDGIFVWEGNRTTFIPSFTLNFNTTYTVAINNTARNVVGNKLDGNANGISEDYSIDAFEWNFTTIAYPELILTDIRVNGNDANDPSITWYFGPGESVTITTKVKNIGHNTTGSSFILALYNVTGPGGGKVPSDISFNYTMDSLGQGQGSGDRTWIWNVPKRSSVRYVNITVDYGNNILEMEELNNSLTLHFAVVPDLTISNITVDGVPLSSYPEGIVVLPGQVINISAKGSNVGLSGTGIFTFNMSFWNCTDTGSNLGSILRHFETLGPLEALTSTTPLYALWQAPKLEISNDYYLNISADSDDDVSESDEDNNHYVLHIRVDGPDPAPDFMELSVADSGFVLDKYADPIGKGLVSSMIYLPLGEDLNITFDAINLGGVNQSLGTSVTFYNTSGLGGGQKDLPFYETSQEYINLSAFGLPNDQTSDNGKTMFVKWINPGVTGIYYINISLDPENRVDELNESNNFFILVINVSILPVTTLIPISQVYYGAEWYINGSTQLNLTPISGFPPLYTLYRVLDNDSGEELQTWMNYTGNASFSLTFGRGSYKIEYYSFYLNVYEEIKNRVIIIDDLPPNTTFDIRHPKYRNFMTDILNISSETPITFYVTDHPLGDNSIGVSNASGVNSPTKPDSGIFYKLWSREFKDYITGWLEYMPGTPIYLPDSLYDGIYEIHYNATDNLGQKEGTKILVVYLDNTSPVTEINMGIPNWTQSGDERVYVSYATQFTLLAKEEVGSGVNSTYYRIFDEENDINITDWIESSSFTFNSSDPNGNYTIKVQTLDNLLNVEDVVSLQVFLDNTEPSSSHDFDYPKYRLRTTDDWNVTENTLIILWGEDEFGSGLEGIYYSIWNDTNELVISSWKYDLPFDLSGRGGDGRYTLRYRAVDNVDNSEDWNEVTVILDSSCPSVTSAAPTGSGNSIRSHIEVLFNEEMDHESVESAFSYTDGVNTYNYTHGFFNWDGKIMTFYPYENLSYDTLYTIRIDTNAMDNLGNKLDGDGDGIQEGPGDIYIWEFQTIEEPDTEPPFILNVSPFDGEQDVPIDSEIIIVFSESMNELSVESAFNYTDNVGTYGSNDGDFTWSGNKMSFKPSIPFSYNTTYTVTLSNMAVDFSGGNPLITSYIWNFTTEVYVDIIPPTVVSSTPHGDSVPIDTIIMVTFSEPMDNVSTEGSFIITPYVEGIFRWENLTLIFTSVDKLEFNTTYYVTIDIMAKDIAGNTIGLPFQFNFTTELDYIPPFIVQFSPAGKGVPVNTTINVTFSENMNSNSVKEAFHIDPSVSGVFTWKESSYIFTPDENLTYNTTYKIIIDTNAKDMNGLNLVTSFNWDFTTEEEMIVPVPVDENETESDEFDIMEAMKWFALGILAGTLFMVFWYYMPIRKRRKEEKEMEEEVMVVPEELTAIEELSAISASIEETEVPSVIPSPQLTTKSRIPAEHVAISTERPVPVKHKKPVPKAKGPMKKPVMVTKSQEPKKPIKFKIASKRPVKKATVSKKPVKRPIKRKN